MYRRILLKSDSSIFTLDFYIVITTRKIQSCVKSFSRNHLIVNVIEFVQNSTQELIRSIASSSSPRSKIFHTRRVVDPADREQTTVSAGWLMQTIIIT